MIPHHTTQHHHHVKHYTTPHHNISYHKISHHASSYLLTPQLQHHHTATHITPNHITLDIIPHHIKPHLITPDRTITTTLQTHHQHNNPCYHPTISKIIPHHTAYHTTSHHIILYHAISHLTTTTLPVIHLPLHSVSYCLHKLIMIRRMSTAGFQRPISVNIPCLYPPPPILPVNAAVSQRGNSVSLEFRSRSGPVSLTARDLEGGVRG